MYVGVCISTPVDILFDFWPGFGRVKAMQINCFDPPFGAFNVHQRSLVHLEGLKMGDYLSIQ